MAAFKYLDVMDFLTTYNIGVNELRGPIANLEKRVPVVKGEDSYTWKNPETGSSYTTVLSAEKSLLGARPGQRSVYLVKDSEGSLLVLKLAKYTGDSNSHSSLYEKEVENMSWFSSLSAVQLVETWLRPSESMRDGSGTGITVMQLCPGGDLFSYSMRQYTNRGFFTEQELINILAHQTLAVAKLHYSPYGFYIHRYKF